MSCSQKTGGFRVTDAQEAELSLFNCFYIIHGLSLNNLSPDTIVFQKLLPKANSPLLNSFPESVFLNPTLNIDLPWRDLIYFTETGLIPPELSNPKMEPCPSWSGKTIQDGDRQTKDTRTSFFPFSESQGQGCLLGLPLIPGHQSI